MEAKGQGRIPTQAAAVRLQPHGCVCVCVLGGACAACVSVSPDACLGEPGLVTHGGNGHVHEGVGLDEHEGVVGELDGALEGLSGAVTRTAARPETTHRVRGHSTAPLRVEYS